MPIECAIAIANNIKYNELHYFTQQSWKNNNDSTSMPSFCKLTYN